MRRCPSLELRRLRVAEPRPAADVNDFDETLAGPWEWDLKRLAASFEIAGRDRGFKRSERHSVVLTAAREYREVMRRLARMSNLDVWYMQVDVVALRDQVASQASAKAVRRMDRNIAKAQRKTRMRAFSKLTERVDGELRIASDPPVLVPFDEIFTGKQLETAEARLQNVLEQYRETLSPERRHLIDGYRHVHTARKVVGVGSVGTRAWIALFVGRDEGDPLFLQVKEAQPSVLEPYTAPSEYPHQGQRVVEGQRLTQSTSDILLGWLTATGPDNRKRDFYVRQLWDQKGSALIEAMEPAELSIYGRVCGAILARAHARSSDRIAIAGYLGGGDSFDRAIAKFAALYADQNERDYDALKLAAKDGRIEVETEVADRDHGDHSEPEQSADGREQTLGSMRQRSEATLLDGPIEAHGSGAPDCDQRNPVGGEGGPRAARTGACRRWGRGPAGSGRSRSRPRSRSARCATRRAACARPRAWSAGCVPPPAEPSPIRARPTGRLPI